MGTPDIELILDDSLQDLLCRAYPRAKVITYPLGRRASIKDIIEALHIPHTEIHSIVRQGREIPFTHIPKGGEQFRLHAFAAGIDFMRPTLLRPKPLRKMVFMVDINVGKLARLLRMAGIDTWYDPDLEEEALAAQAATSNRILLTRNRDLLQRKIITWGHLVRAEHPEQQLAEVIALYDPGQAEISPFSRCLECNTSLQPVEKSTILHRLEPLTIKYYQVFHRCPDCERIYWRGSHHNRMRQLLHRIQ